MAPEYNAGARIGILEVNTRELLAASQRDKDEIERLKEDLDEARRKIEELYAIVYMGKGIGKFIIILGSIGAGLATSFGALWGILHR